ncbi:MAG: DUF362 domain-containing protein, partial [Filifactoraceae bacterium]
GKSIFLKVNLLRKQTPDKNITTHPTVVKAVCEYIIENGGKPIIGDSPAGPFNKAALEGIYDASGLALVAKETGAKLNYNFDFTEINFINASMLKNFLVIDGVLNADMVVCLAKFKTHGMMTYTGGVKNLFGVIPGLTKAKYHVKLESPTNFANHLVDICEFIKPIFTIIDGIEAMEGNGPNSGFTRKLGYILAGENPYDVDEVALKIAKIDPALVPTSVVARNRGLVSCNIDCNLVNEDLKKIEPFVLPESISVNFVSGRMPNFIANMIVGLVKSKPIFDKTLCIGCGHCERICPAGIIEVKGSKAVYSSKECISCFCCHEVCPVHAINIKTPFLGRLVLKG